MKIGAIRDDSGVEFAVSHDGSRWIVLSELGLHYSMTDEIINEFDTIREASLEAEGRRIEKNQFVSPVVRPRKMLAVGLNYVDHARETGAEAPARPVVFAKYTSSLNGPFDDVRITPVITEEADYEVELAVVIGKKAAGVGAERAMEHVFGYAVANDVSARDWQRIDSQFSRSKSADTFCPLGPWITTSDEIAEVRKLELTSSVNGDPRQIGVVSDMVFDIPTLIEYLSSTITLHAGDVLLTGTPPGVGMGMKPPSFLRDGDVVECSITGLGSLRNRFTG